MLADGRVRLQLQLIYLLADIFIAFDRLAELLATLVDLDEVYDSVIPWTDYLARVVALPAGSSPKAIEHGPESKYILIH